MAKGKTSAPAVPKKTPPAAAAPKAPAVPNTPTPDPALAGLPGGDTSAQDKQPDPTESDPGAGETQDKQPDPGKGEPVVTHFRIAALTDGFRRCGRAWPAAGVEVAAEDLAEGDIERLLAEPELVVTPIAEGAA